MPTQPPRGDDSEPGSLGAGSSDDITILSGLSAGELVAVGDFAQLKDGAKIRVEQ